MAKSHLTVLAEVAADCDRHEQAGLKLDARKERAIRAALAKGESQTAIAAAFGYSRQNLATWLARRES